ncbi:hypothetical protein CTEN210_00462 [Chaetoceros tenuissimus]|uniref:Hexosyltransferase n=1 Tax=Chaetoceros tenuissimus TaxID=426638 RepID=A0AAD3CDV0_9STRA|nr:hypothetical protein CTEN210_00462 [Chaetoceros tenuissimus]
MSSVKTTPTLSNDHEIEESNTIDHGGRIKESPYPPASTTMESLDRHKRQTRVLMGVFTINGYFEKRQRSKVRTLFQVHPDICTIEEAKAMAKAEHPTNDKYRKREACKLIYTFVFGGRFQDQNATTKIFNSTLVPTDKILMSTKETLSKAEYTRDESPDDLTFLNIRENMEDGKSLTWFNYAVNYATKDIGEVDWVGKMDSDTMVYLDQFFEFYEKNLFPYPYNRNTICGKFLNKNSWNQSMTNFLEKEEDWFHINMNDNHLYTAGELYLLSNDLAKSTIATLNADEMLYENYTHGIEDHDTSTIATIAAGGDTKSAINVKWITKKQQFWMHGVKRKFGLQQFRRYWNDEVTRIQNLLESKVLVDNKE